MNKKLLWLTSTLAVVVGFSWLAHGCRGGGTAASLTDPARLRSSDEVPRVCTAGGICWQNPLPHGATIQKLWGTGPEDIYALAYSTVLHFDGRGWEIVVEVDEGPLTALHGTGPDDVYAVGYSGLVLHYDGAAWMQVPTENAANFLDLWVFAPDELLTVGEWGQTMARRGDRWTVPWVERNDLTAVWGVDRRNVFVGTTDGEVIHRQRREEIFHEVGRDVRALWGSADNDVYAVADGHVHHFDGGSWTQQTEGDPRLFALHGNSAGTVLAAGMGGTILRLDGHQWIAEPADTDADLFALWVSQDGTAWAGGRSGTLLRYDGQRWVNNRHGLDMDLNGAWALGPQDIFAVGDGGTVARYNGEAWTKLTFPDDGDLEAVWAAPSGAVFVGGRRGVFRFDAAGWSNIHMGTVTALWGTSETNVYGAAKGAVFRYDGAATKREQTPQGRWTAIHGSSEDDIYVVGERGKMAHFDGSVWTEVKTGTEAWLGGVWAKASDDVVAVGSEGTILHYDGSRWTKTGGKSYRRYFAAWARGAGPYYVLGGNVVRTSPDGRTWTDMPLHSSGLLFGVTGTGDSNLYIVGSKGAILAQEQAPSRAHPLFGLETGKSQALREAEKRALDGAKRRVRDAYGETKGKAILDHLSLLRIHPSSLHPGGFSLFLASVGCYVPQGRDEHEMCCDMAFELSRRGDIEQWDICGRVLEPLPQEKRERIDRAMKASSYSTAWDIRDGLEEVSQVTRVIIFEAESHYDVRLRPYPRLDHDLSWFRIDKATLEVGRSSKGLY